jgi:hypothetical protein
MRLRKHLEDWQVRRYMECKGPTTSALLLLLGRTHNDELRFGFRLGLDALGLGFRRRLIKDQFDCESRGTIKVKGADDMEVWHVLGRKADPRPAVESPV